MSTFTNNHADEMGRPFEVTRVVRPGRSVTNSPKVVKCVWTQIRTENLAPIVASIEQMSTGRGCWMHKNCKGHLPIEPDTMTYLIPYGYAAGDELVQSDGFAMNKAVLGGDKGASDMAEFCFKRLSGKRGILRKSCNGCRPTNSMRFLLSPPPPPGFRPEVGVIYVPEEPFVKGKFVHISRDGRCSMRALKEGEVVVFGRCPSQGPDSALPMMVGRLRDGVKSVRVPLEVCPLNNADYDGDEGWFYVSVTDDAQDELVRAWHRVWGNNRIPNIIATVESIVPTMTGRRDIDSVMYSTMTFEEMSMHRGGHLYTTLMLKPKSWNAMYRTMMSKSYWLSFMERSKAGIVNTMMSVHGVSGPYGAMRLGMMLGTCVGTNQDAVSIASPKAPLLPVVSMPMFVNRMTCSLAMTKLTKILYQRGIDLSKHGSVMEKPAAIEALFKASEYCYAITHTAEGPAPSMMPTTVAMSRGDVCTSLSSMTGALTGRDLLTQSVLVIALVEEVDGINLTDAERIAAAFLLSFLSMNVHAIMDVNIIDTIYALSLDWYTSITCSDIRWIKQVMRNPAAYPDASVSTDISSTLGSIMIGNLSMITSESSRRVMSGTVASNDWWDESSTGR